MSARRAARAAATHAATSRAELRRERKRAERRRLGQAAGGLGALAVLAGGALALVPGTAPASAGDADLAQVAALASADPQAYTVSGAAGQIDTGNAVVRDAGESSVRAEETAQVSVIDTSPAALKLVAAQMIQQQQGWGADQMQCLDLLWTKESGWRWNAENPESGAYGIPQSWPAEKLATAGADWRTNPITQMQWGIDYIAAAHGTPCAAWYQHNGSY